MSERDIEREEEVSRQRGYGEQFRNERSLSEQPAGNAGYKEGAPVAEQEPAEIDLVTDMEDERVPNVPNDGMDDASDASGEPHDVYKQPPSGHELEDAYEQNDPGIETKE